MELKNKTEKLKIFNKIINDIRCYKIKINDQLINTIIDNFS
jgi:hypothetical protein